ncbi:MAG: hypothetical protein KAH23_10325 [Kiritimatiellae bacterium]|nr:hypothetical protein [Kiritimatiellia bacterium]
MKLSDLTAESLKLAIWTCFPTTEIFHDLKEDRRNISFIRRLTELAMQKKLVEKNSDPLLDIHRLEELIKTNNELHKGRRPSQEFTFDSLMTEIKKDRSIKGLVKELKDMATDLCLEEPNEVLFTRMKKDPHSRSIKRRHALLLLSIWLIINKPDLDLSYNSLTIFPRSLSDSVVDETSGVLAVFAFIGENIDAATVDFLKTELPICIWDLKLTYLNEKRLSFPATTCMAKFPVRESAVGYPVTYGHAMRDALSLAYQMVITWQLSAQHSSRINLIISIDAGDFVSREITIKDLMSPDLPAESPIRLSHFAYTAAKQADLKVVFRSVKYPNIWSADHFWSFPYFKSPPVLMAQGIGAVDDTEILPVTDDAVKAFREALFLKDSKDYGILPMVHNYPPRILASLEVAHVTTLRRLHHEAIQLLFYVLSFDPLNHIARTLRMHNYMALSICTQYPDTASLLFKRAIHDGQFIENRCIPDPEFYAEYSLAYWAMAIKLIKFMRKGIIFEKIDETMSEVLMLLTRSEECAMKGLSVSTSGADSRCGYWLLYSMAFRRLLEKDPELMTNINRPMADSHNLFPEIFDSFTGVSGWMPPMDSTGRIDEGFMEKRALRSSETFLNSLSSTSQYPHAAFGVCNFLWDFSGPKRKKLIIDYVLLLLEKIRMKIKVLKGLCIGTYSATPTLMEIQSPREYITCIERVTSKVTKVKETGNYDTGVMLLMLNFDFETSSVPITFDLIKKEEV